MLTGKLLLTFIFFLYCINLGYAQTISPTDTIQLQEVEIKEEKINFLSIKTIDSLQLVKHQHLTLATLAQKQSSLFIKEYAPGGISTPSYRGTGASHTYVTWESFPVNSSMLGQIDFSAIPLIFFDNIKFYSGISSLTSTGSSINSGIGGNIDLQSNVHRSQPFGFSIIGQYGSFNKQGTGGSVLFNTKKMHSKTAFSFISSENNYPYVNNVLQDRPTEKRINANYSKIGVFQQLYYFHKKSHTCLKFWMQQNYNKLAAPIIQPQIPDNELIEQENYRLIAGHKIFHNKSATELKLFLSYDVWDYTNKNLNIFTNNIIQNGSLLLNHSFKIKKIVETQIEYSSVIENVETVNYAEPEQSVSTHNLGCKTQTSLNNYFSLITNLITKYRNNQDMHFLQYGGIAWNNKSNHHAINLLAGKNIRYPSMNDLYWNPGGNPNLKPENSLSFEVCSENKIFENWVVKTSIYKTLIDNWIIWLPSEIISIWKPQNINKVETQGMDFENNFYFDFGKIFFKNIMAASVCNSIDKSSAESKSYGKQIIYVPQFQANNVFSVEFKKFDLQYTTLYTGKRYTNISNTSYMPSYILHNIGISMQVKHKKLEMTLNINVNNILNTNYQTVAYFPMPKRYFEVVLRIRIY